MLLIIEESLAESNRLNQSIADLEVKLRKSTNDLETFNKKLHDLKGNLVTFENKMKNEN